MSINKLFLYLENELVKARLVEPWEELSSPLKWGDLEFEITSSSLRMVTWPNLIPELSPETARSFLDLIASRYPFSRDRAELQKICPQLLFKDNVDEWVFFAGTFNPWHKGHQACLNLLPKDKWCFILPDKNPFKEDSLREPVATSLELIRKINFGPHHYFVPTFLINQEKNPTINWIEQVRSRFPEQKLSLLMGFDSFKSLESWHRSEDLLKNLNKIYVVSRLEDDSERDEGLGPIKRTAPHLEIEFLGRHEFENLSSTELRKKT